MCFLSTACEANQHMQAQGREGIEGGTSTATGRPAIVAGIGLYGMHLPSSYGAIVMVAAGWCCLVGQKFWTLYLPFVWVLYLAGSFFSGSVSCWR